MTGAGAPVRLHLNRLGEWEELRGAGELMRRAGRRALEAAGEAGPAEISLTCLPAGEMARLNREWLEREGPTDVIAFPLEGGDGILGDVYLCPEVALRSAREAGVDPREEMVRLAVHGVLHVLGHDHPEDDDRWASPMYRLQERVVEDVLG
jgi:probable rRNA maturation factor